MSDTAIEINNMSTRELCHFSVNMEPKLDTGETLTGTPTITESSGNLTLTNKAVSTAILSISGTSVAIGQAVQFTADAAENGSYTVVVVCTTSSGQIKDLELIVNVC